jgi:SAM-dependent methyltransferase
MMEQLYTTGEYLKKNPTWHVGESPWKAEQITRILARNSIEPKTICEIGCGAGEILRLLQERLDSECTFWGYEISPQAFELCKSRENEKLHFRLLDIKEEKKVYYDLILVMDVLEHMENYFDLLRDIKTKSEYKIFHVPMDISVRSVLWGHFIDFRDSYGHIHYFTKEIALRTLEDAGYEVLDFFYTIDPMPLPWHEINRNPRLLLRKILGQIKRGILRRGPEKLLSILNKDFAVRVFGERRLLILAV